MDYLHIYDLSFVPAGNKGGGSNPYLVFSIGARHLEVLQEKLHFLTTQSYDSEAIARYLGTHSEFIQLESDLFGNHTFGYNRSAYMLVNEDKARFYFELRNDLDARVTCMNIYTLLRVLNYMLVTDDVTPANYPQSVQIDTMCKNDLHGHSTGGRISPDVGKWLKKQGATVPEEERGFFASLRLEEVGEVMSQTWHKLGGYSIDKNECRAIISPDGKFSLMCPGNACDLSIYPDSLHGDDLGTRSVAFSCHNLDSPRQQLTLLAGLAKLCEMAQADQ